MAENVGRWVGVEVTVFFAALIIAVVAGLIAYPLVLKEGVAGTRRAGREGKRTDSRLDEIDAALQQLEVDLQTGVVTEEEYVELELKYRRRAEAIRGRTKGPKKEKKLREEDDIERRVANRRRSKRLNCPKCGAAVQEGNKFCPECGTPIAPGR